MLTLDTNIFVFFLANSLRQEEQRAMEDDPHWAISDIVLWELAQLAELRRFSFRLRDRHVQALLELTDVVPIDMEIALQAQRLDVGTDPVDRLIAATSIVHWAPLLTRDARILSSRLVPLAIH